MENVIIIIATFLISTAVAIPTGILIRKKTAESKIKSAEVEAKTILENAKKEAENAKKEEILKAKEEILGVRNELDLEIKDRRGEVKEKERRIIQKEENLERRENEVLKNENEIQNIMKEYDEKTQDLSEMYEKQLAELQRISGLSENEAKSILLEELDEKLTDEKATLIREAELKAKEESVKNAREIVSFAIQKCAADHTAETTVSVVALPNDDMKGRIIGREGRNIKTLETLTGIDLIIDDTPEAVILSGFDPLRREVAKIALEKLIEDRKNSSSKN